MFFLLILSFLLLRLPKAAKIASITSTRMRPLSTNANLFTISFKLGKFFVFLILVPQHHPNHYYTQKNSHNMQNKIPGY